MAAWRELAEREAGRYEERLRPLPDDDGERQRALTRVATAAYGAGLAHLMLREAAAAGRWLGLAAERYRESYAGAPPGSWGRPIGALKARLLAGDRDRAREEARWALDEGAEAAESAIGAYAAALACLVLERWTDARVHAGRIRARDDFPAAVADALAAIAAEDVVAYTAAVEEVLRSFETRHEHLEDVPVADTVLVLQALAATRGLAARLESELLPPG